MLPSSAARYPPIMYIQNNPFWETTMHYTAIQVNRPGGKPTGRNVGLCVWLPFVYTSVRISPLWHLRGPQYSWQCLTAHSIYTLSPGQRRADRCSAPLSHGATTGRGHKQLGDEMHLSPRDQRQAAIQPCRWSLGERCITSPNCLCPAASNDLISYSRQTD